MTCSTHINEPDMRSLICINYPGARVCFTSTYEFATRICTFGVRGACNESIDLNQDHCSQGFDLSAVSPAMAQPGRGTPVPDFHGAIWKVFFSRTQCLDGRSLNSRLHGPRYGWWWVVGDFGTSTLSGFTLIRSMSLRRLWSNSLRPCRLGFRPHKTGISTTTRRAATRMAHDATLPGVCRPPTRTNNSRACPNKPFDVFRDNLAVCGYY